MKTELKRVIAIDDSNRPNDIKISNWIKKGELYTPIGLINSKLTGDKAYRLSEIDPGNPLYAGYNIKRFAVIDISDLLEQISIEDDIEELEPIGFK